MILVWIFVATQVVDAWSTWQALRLGKGIENNPIVAWLMARVGVFWALVVTKCFASAIVVVGHFYGAWSSDLGQGALIALIGFYGWVLWGNFRVLYGRR